MELYLLLNGIGLITNIIFGIFNIIIPWKNKLKNKSYYEFEINGKIIFITGDVKTISIKDTSE